MATVDRGVCSLLARSLDGQRLDNAISDVRGRVLSAIDDRKIIDASFVRSIVKLHGSAKTRTKAPVDAQGVKKIQEAMNTGELEVLHRYYVLGESTTKIAEAMGLDIEAIQAMKQRARRAFRPEQARVLTTTVQ